MRQLASEFAKMSPSGDERIDVNPHNLRHTFATWLARSSSNISLVQKILGHEDVNTTLRYYVHTGDYELVGATANLRGRSEARESSVSSGPKSFKVIPFPQQRAV